MVDLDVRVWRRAADWSIFVKYFLFKVSNAHLVKLFKTSLGFTSDFLKLLSFKHIQYLQICQGWERWAKLKVIEMTLQFIKSPFNVDFVSFCKLPFLFRKRWLVLVRFFGQYLYFLMLFANSWYFIHVAFIFFACWDVSTHEGRQHGSEGLDMDVNYCDIQQHLYYGYLILSWESLIIPNCLLLLTQTWMKLRIFFIFLSSI